MTGDELIEWVSMLTRASAAYDMKRDDLWKAMAELDAAEKEKVVADIRGVAAFVQAVAQVLTTLGEHA